MPILGGFATRTGMMWAPPPSLVGLQTAKPVRRRWRPGRAMLAQPARQVPPHAIMINFPAGTMDLEIEGVASGNSAAIVTITKG
jgi:hypothetical protein